jgi:phosphoenolpyruvate synthase/pyruvate phosphate dikinase
LASLQEGKLGQEYYEELKSVFNLLTQIRLPLIIRSSTNLEDSSHYSYAGIFYSQPNINTVEELISAITTSWQNLINRAETIKQYSGETRVTLNLIVQSYIKGQFGGVLFTERSTPGLMQVEIAAGGAEGVTLGNNALTSLSIDEKGQPVHAIGEKNILSNDEYQELYRLGRELEVLYGAPQDIEWVIADKKIYIIQSRDISKRDS